MNITDVFHDYASEVQAEADRMVQNGEGAPWDVYSEAHRRVQRRRQRQKTADRPQGTER
jgi:hypothetical protein